MVRVGGARALAASPAALYVSCGLLVVVLCRLPLFPLLNLVARPCDGRGVARPLCVPGSLLRSLRLARVTSQSMVHSPWSMDASAARASDVGFSRVLPQSSLIRIRLEFVGVLANAVA